MGKVEDQLINKYKADDSKSLVPRVDSHVGKDRFGVDVPFEIAARKFDPNAPSMADAEYVRTVAEWLVPGAAAVSGVDMMREGQLLSGGLMVGASVVKADKLYKGLVYAQHALIKGGRKFQGMVFGKGEGSKFLSVEIMKKIDDLKSGMQNKYKDYKFMHEAEQAFIKHNIIPNPTKVLPPISRKGSNWVRDARGSLHPTQAGIPYTEGVAVKAHKKAGTFFDDVGDEAAIMAREVSEMTTNQALSMAKSGLPINAELRDQAIKAAKHVFRNDSQRMKMFMDLIDESYTATGARIYNTGTQNIRATDLKDALRIVKKTGAKKVDDITDLLHRLDK